MSAEWITPVDQSARKRISGDLESTLFVEAGAGSGKTKALVDRIVALIASGVALKNVAAITFTEKAAAELRGRLRSALVDHLANGDPDGCFASALDELDGAAISTLHSFAQRLLFEHPIEAGLPPGVEVLDELASQVAFDERWDQFFPSMLNDPELAGPLLLADVFSIKPSAMRDLAVSFENNWDLLGSRLVRDPPALSVDATALIAELRALGRHAAACNAPDDRLAETLAAVATHADALEARDCSANGAEIDADVDRLIDMAELLSAGHPRFATDKGMPFIHLGNKANWSGDGELMSLIKSDLHAAGERRSELCRALIEGTIEHLAAAIGSFVLEGVAQRRREGRLRFHDLLVLARELLRSPDSGDEVRSAVGQRYQRLLIDEFQDTDPIQVELAVLIAANGTVQGRTWSEIETEPGRLFFVGDPKQSIYRFRRADIATYLEAQRIFGGSSGSHDGPEGNVALTCNFRSSVTVIDWVNETFRQLIEADEGSQPAYLALDATQPATSAGPGVARLGADAHQGKRSAKELRALEADDVVRTICTAVDTGWTVRDSTVEDGERRCRLGDITILLPARTSLPELERALEDAGIAYRAETASLVYATAEVRELLIIARAIDDPTDELAMVHALRSPGFGCGDDDLARYIDAVGPRWDHQRIPEGIDRSDIVVAGLEWMARMHDERIWATPAEILDRIIEGRRLMELGVLDGRHREVWRRLRFVTDQARAWSESTGGSLREYLQWARLQASDSARIAETVLPETDTDAVRIMTIHGSKGLEFPITIVSGLSTREARHASSVEVAWPPEGGIGYKLGAKNTTSSYDKFVPIDEQMGEHERLRLLYVACTRAVDHLIFSTHRSTQGPSRNSLAAKLSEVLETAAVDPDEEPEDVVRRGHSPPHAPGPVPRPSKEHWRQDRDTALASAKRTRTVAATAVAAAVAATADDPGLAKGPRDLDLPSWQKGRYGTAVGRAVHGVLQSVDLVTGDGLVQIAAAQAAAEGVLGQEDLIAQLARSALDSEIVIEAGIGRARRELYVAAPIGERLLEGYIDLVYETAAGYVIVDYKTDAIHSEGDLAAKVAHYRVQLAAYALALEAVTGTGVDRAVLLFLAPSGAHPVILDDLGDARQAAEAMIAAIVDGDAPIARR